MEDIEYKKFRLRPEYIEAVQTVDGQCYYIKSPYIMQSVMHQETFEALFEPVEDDEHLVGYEVSQDASKGANPSGELSEGVMGMPNRYHHDESVDHYD